MWNDAQALNRLANLAFALSALLVAYAGVMRAAQHEFFALREIRIVGTHAHVTRNQIEEVILGQLRGNFFTVNLAHAQAAFEKLPWVRRVDVRRRWPDAVEIALEEHQPMARWGSAALVNAYGEVFDGASNRKLPVLSGPEGSAGEVVANYAAFQRALAPIGRTIEQVRLSQRRAWRIHLDDTTVIELGRDDSIQRLEQFAAAFNRSIALLEGRSAYIDLRYANGFAVRMKGLNWSEKRA